MRASVASIAPLAVKRVDNAEQPFLVTDTVQTEMELTISLCIAFPSVLTTRRSRFVRLKYDPPFAFQLPQSFAHWSMAHLELFRQVILAQRLSWS